MRGDSKVPYYMAYMSRPATLAQPQPATVISKAEAPRTLVLSSQETTLTIFCRERSKRRLRHFTRRLSIPKSLVSISKILPCLTKLARVRIALASSLSESIHSVGILRTSFPRRTPLMATTFPGRAPAGARRRVRAEASLRYKPAAGACRVTSCAAHHARHPRYRSLRDGANFFVKATAHTMAEHFSELKRAVLQLGDRTEEQEKQRDLWQREVLQRVVALERRSLLQPAVPAQPTTTSAAVHGPISCGAN
jgi:hypothetical protein